ncbi:MAG TPA: MBL fold metallo-hydrolase [Rhizomicrobium sp.]|jgi:metallo-beta-lactamase class B|nr:MBL fold metallo-hydrolase [Rhizomicrobium sp.]
MKKRFGAALLAATFGLAHAAPVPDTVEAHVLAAQKAAGLDFAGTLDVLCIQPADGSDPGAAERAANAGRVRANPPRESWFAEPARVFDNVYWVGTKINSAWAIKTSAGIILLDTMYNYAAETEIVDGLKKLGLDPATIKYVIVSHGHGDHDEGAKMLQDRYGTHVIMGAPDWDAITKANNMPGGVPKRDMVATNGMKVTLGEETVTIYLTPGHTLGTLSMLFPVKDNGKTLEVAYSGGMGFNFPRSPERFDTYIASARKFADAAKAAGATIIFSNHSMYDQAWTRSRWQRKPGEVSPFVVGADGVQRYFTVLSECAKAAKLRLKPS